MDCFQSELFLKYTSRDSFHFPLVLTNTCPSTHLPDTLINIVPDATTVMVADFADESNSVLAPFFANAFTVTVITSPTLSLIFLVLKMSDIFNDVEVVVDVTIVVLPIFIVYL